MLERTIQNTVPKRHRSDIKQVLATQSAHFGAESEKSWGLCCWWGEPQTFALDFNCLHMRRFPSYIITSPSQSHYIAPITSLLIYSAHRKNCVSKVIFSCSFSFSLPWADVPLCPSQPLSLTHNHNLSQIQRLMLIMDIGVAPISFISHYLIF